MKKANLKVKFGISGVAIFYLLLVAWADSDIPNLPSDVYVDRPSNILFVRKPYEVPRPFLIRGVSWAPATRAPAEGPNPLSPNETVQYGFFFDWAGRYPQGHEVLNYWLESQLSQHYLRDIPLIKQMNANTVRIYYIMDNAADFNRILDEFYRNGIMVIITVAISSNDFADANIQIYPGRHNYLDIVNLYKNHPAVLAWAIGNEWNLNRFYDNWSLEEATQAVNLAAQRIRETDSHHPVCSILGDVFDNNPGECAPAWTIRDILQRCPNIDLWGLNVYRGNSFGNLFEQWRNLWQLIGQPAKPFYISEFGTDSFYSNGYTPVGSCPPKADNVSGYQDQQRQANLLVALWNEIKAHLLSSSGQLCLGGLIFEFNDELWKVGNYHVGLGGLVDYNNPPDSHSYDHYNEEGFVVNGSSPDNVLNEEYFGLVDTDRIPKIAYNVIRELFKLDYKPPIAKIIAKPQVGYSPFKVRFSGANSSDPDGKIVSYFWSFGDGTSSNQINPIHSYQNKSWYKTVYYTTTLTVKDNQGASSKAKVIIKVYPAWKR